MPLLIIYYMSCNAMSFVGGRRRRSSVVGRLRLVPTTAISAGGAVVE